MPTRPEWQLPSGVTPGLWDYLHSAEIAQRYDDRLAGSALLQADLQFARRHFDRPGRLIDLGCGTGRLLIPFAQRDYWVLGADLSHEMLRVAERKAGAAGVEVHLLQANLVELDGVRNSVFDYAACLFSTLGMIAGPSHRAKVIAHVFRVLRPGGTFVLHVHNRWFNVWSPGGWRWVAADVFKSMTGNDRAGDRHMPVHEGVANLTLHLFTRREVARLLHEAGFELLEIQPVRMGTDGRTRGPRVLSWLTAYGYLFAARKPLR